MNIHECTPDSRSVGATSSDLAQGVSVVRAHRWARSPWCQQLGLRCAFAHTNPVWKEVDPKRTVPFLNCPPV